MFLGVQDGSLAERLRMLHESGRIEAKLYEWAVSWAMTLLTIWTSESRSKTPLTA